MQLDILEWTRRCALDSLTMTSFGVSLNAIEGTPESQDVLHTFDGMLYVIQILYEFRIYRDASEDCLGKTSVLKYFLRETLLAGIYPSILGLALIDRTFIRSLLGTYRGLSKAISGIRKSREANGNSESRKDLLALLGIFLLSNFGL